ncbi:transcriptional repressor [Pseudaeromonas sp. ZJS20]|uniref:Fur family transcriptional regulator n=1 Tax=Pseudaeromonas aegiceratis TaxID=3153928 RepID=UPI00390CAA12
MSDTHGCCGHQTAKLTPNRQQVLQQLEGSPRPLSAYELLDRLKTEGIVWQPPTAYRALDYLVSVGLVHYLQSVQKYVACPRRGCDHYAQLLICVRCSQVQELPLPVPLLTLLRSQAAEQAFTLLPQMLELKGVCAQCSVAETTTAP